MFEVNGSEIRLSRGDTGAIKFKAIATMKGTGESYHFGPNDRALFTIRSSADRGTIIERAYEIENDEFVVYFRNADTDQVAAGTYTWDVRYVINAVLEDGRIVDGDQVITPELPMNLQLLTVVGDI